MEGPVQGIKLELFIFDSFAFADSVVLIEVERSEEFLPVKNANAPGAKDCPQTARDSLMAMHTKWVVAAGGTVKQQADEPLIEVAPLLSYAGEGLEARCSGKAFDAKTCLE